MSDLLNTAGETSETAAPATETADTTATEQGAADQQTQTTETDTAAQESDGQGEQGEKPGAPEQYEFQAPEGQAFDAAVLEAYSDVAKELNLSQEDAQKLLDKVAPVMQARQQEQIAQVQEDWANATRADKELGGDKLDASLSVAKKALDAFATPELKTLLNQSGLGNNPEVIRFMYRAGKAMSEDKIVTGRQTTGGDKSLAEKLYSQ